VYELINPSQYTSYLSPVCLDSCVYVKKDADPNNQYCFVSSEQQTKCYTEIERSILLDVVDSQSGDPITNAKVNMSYYGQDGSGSPEVILTSVSVESDGRLKVNLEKDGIYRGEVKADGFISKSFTVEMQCSSLCETKKKLVMSPTLDQGQVRIIMSWGEVPSDMDIHVWSFNKANESDACKTYYSHSYGCPEITLDKDSCCGGPETVTLNDATVNQNYVYVIGAHDYGDEEDGLNLLKSQAIMEVTDGLITENAVLTADSIDTSGNAPRWYLFGCLTVTSSGQFTFTAAPHGTWFDGDNDEEWVTMKQTHC